MKNIFQVPNPPLIIALVGWIFSKFPQEIIHRLGSTTFTIAIIIWAYLEIVSGANWFRRLLGLVVMLTTAYLLFHQLN